MTFRIAINGFGRIGRNHWRINEAVAAAPGGSMYGVKLRAEAATPDEWGHTHRMVDLTRQMAADR